MMLDVRRWLIISSLAGWLGCAAADEDAPLPPTQMICDGSDSMRFVFTTFRGFGNVGGGFTGKYGSGYLAIDGHCDYWLGSDTLSGLRTGTLQADTAAALPEEMHFGRYLTVADHRDPDGCPDAGLSVIDDGTATLRADCFQRDGAPRVYFEAFMRVFSLYTELDASAESAWQRSTLLALRDPPELAADQPGMPRTPSAWTASLDLEPRAVTRQDLSRGLEPDAGVLVEDGPTQALLGELRSAALQRDPYALDLLVRDDRERAYQLLVRDEPPDAVRIALETATAAAMALAR